MLKKIIQSFIVTSLLVIGSASAVGATTHQLQVPAQWQTMGPGISYPGSTDATLTLPHIDQLAFDCIRFHESRNHLVDGSGSQGWYQFTQGTWNSAANALGLPTWTNTWSPNDASGNMQSEVAVWYFKRNGRFGVQWAAEANECPGVFYF
jgi:hypothetical protein